MPETKEAKKTEDGLNVRIFQIRADTFREEDNSFGAVIATDAPVVVFDWGIGDIVEEILRIDGVVIPKSGQVPLLDTHARWSIKNQVGSTREINSEEHKITARLYISSTEPDATTKVKEGHVTDCSVGYATRSVTRIGPGQSTEVKGETYKAGELPLHVVTKWDLRENSLCPIGADVDAKIRSMEIGAGAKERLVDLLTSTEWRKGSMDGEKENVDHVEELVEQTAPPAAPVTEGRELVLGMAPIKEPELQRRAEIMDLTPPGMEATRDLCIAEGKTVEEARALILAKLAEQTKPVGTPTPEDATTRGEVEVKVKDVSDKDFTRSICG